MTTARFLVGDVFERMAELPDGSVDLVMTSPPFLALRSYLPADHPDKGKEIGSEATPAEFIDTLLALTTEWRRLLAPHGSICVELGDTYSGSGGAGGDYTDTGLRAGQAKFEGSAIQHRRTAVRNRGCGKDGGGEWPLDKSLCGIPTLYAWSLAYGRNLLTGEPSPAGMWRVRNVKPWIRSNPPVGALGDKERPATSYITVATIARDRYFDLDGVRSGRYEPHSGIGKTDSYELERAKVGLSSGAPGRDNNPAGSPPLDWWHHVDAVLDACIEDMARNAGKPYSHGMGEKDAAGGRGGGWHQGKANRPDSMPGARGVHLRRALERAGILTTLEALDVSPKGYSGAHYAVWPPELVKLLVQEMCPHRVCTTCGEPSRRIVEHERRMTGRVDPGWKQARSAVTGGGPMAQAAEVRRTTVGWTDCGHDTWRPGLVLDPFAGSGTTLEVATGMGRDAVGIDIDERNADLARERVGMFLDVDVPEREASA